MKKKMWVSAFAFTFAAMLALSGCGSFGGHTPKTFVIQYTDGAGTHQLQVTEGMPYTLENVPERFGYVFEGLFDAESGGVQYVNKSGASLAPFTGKESLVLYPQFTPKQYTLILEADEDVTGEFLRSQKISYDEELPALPTQLTAPHRTFSGWYTEEEREGIQIADKRGVLPARAKVNETNLPITANTEFVYLYAGFSWDTYQITLKFGEGKTDETITAEYGTDVRDLVYQTRDAQGCAVLTWSKQENGTPFTGKIEEDTTLYALEWAPVIQLDSNGGEALAPVVARAGDPVELPTPIRPLYRFMGWEYSDGKTANIDTMPEEGASLRAKWQAKIVFDSNGGETVDELSEAAGTTISLPIPSREGYIFGGWYTEGKEKFEKATMPAVGTSLKAGWYAAKTTKTVFLDGEDTSSLIYSKAPQLKSSYYINFPEIVPELNWTKPVTVELKFHAEFRHETERNSIAPIYNTKEHFYFYSQEVVSDAYFLGKCLADHGKGGVNTNYTACDFGITLTVQNGMLYTALGTDKEGAIKPSVNADTWHVGWRMRNFWAEIIYPDLSHLYL